MTLAELALTGDLIRPARLTVPRLLRWPQHRADVSFECATSGIRHHRFAGPRLYDVLADAGPGFDPGRRKDRLRFLIAVTGNDGHHAVLSWAEIDPDFAAAPVLLAVSIDDTPLDAAGPQLVLPRDRCGARHISGITAIRVGGGYRFEPDGSRGSALRRPAPATPGRASVAGRLGDVWQLVGGCVPDTVLHGGTAAPVAGPVGLPGALAQARYALSAARTGAPGTSRLTDATSLTSLDGLLAGVPAEVRRAFGAKVLGPLLETGRPPTAAPFDTLETFLACDGSWARTAQALHLHVNTVHYRVERIQRLTDRLDLWAALLCR